MPFVIKKRHPRHAVVAMSHRSRSDSPGRLRSHPVQSPSSRFDAILSVGSQPYLDPIPGHEQADFENLEDVDDVEDVEDMGAFNPHHVATAYQAAALPFYLTEFPKIRDFLQTNTSEEQDKTVLEVLPWMTGLTEEGRKGVPFEDGVPSLLRAEHIAFLHKWLGRLPPGAVSADASRPWFLYWCLLGLSILGEDISPYTER